MENRNGFHYTILTRYNYIHRHSREEKKRMQFAHCHKLILRKMHDVHKLKGLIIVSWLIHGTLGIFLDPLGAVDRWR